MLFFFHLFLAILAVYPKKNWVLFAHHIGISLLIGIILVDFYRKIIKSEFIEQKQLARYYFHIGLILFASVAS